MKLVSIVLASLLTVFSGVEKPSFETRIFPKMRLYSPVKPPVFTVFAEIKGEETEKYYCPKIRWSVGEGIDKIVSEEESDCPPFEKRHQRVYSVDEACKPYIKEGEAYFPIVSIPNCAPREPFGYPNFWSKRYVGSSPGRYIICAELVKSDNVVAKSCVKAVVAGD